MKKEVKLNAKQQEAVDWNSGPLLVLAGPGTGKTQLLSQRVARILTETDAGPETVLCLTYTESGATSMRERLLSTIKAEAYKVNIHTYHAFGATILSAYQNYADHFGRRMDAPVDAVTQYKIVRRIQLEMAPNDILRGDKIKDILSTIGATKGARLTADDLRKVVKRNRADSEKINAALAPVMARFAKGMRYPAVLPIYKEMLETLATFYDAKPIVPRVEPLANGMIATLNALIDAEEANAAAYAAEEAGAAKPSTKKLNAWREQNFEVAEDGSYRLSNRVAILKLESFANVLEKYEAEMAEAGLYDFPDMIEEAIRVLREDAGFRMTMSERFQHILLDEFQDTNPSQFELIKLLCDYEQPDVMAVGDDDQAIYEFQGAKASNLSDFVTHFDAHVVILDTNYRSYGEIVDAAKKVSGQIDDSFSRTQRIEKPLAAFKGYQGEVIERHEFVSADAEYYWAAAEIARLVDAGVPQREIAVIMRKHDRILPLLPYLRAYPQVKVAYERRENLFADEKIHQLIQWARLINNIAKGRPWASSLMEILSFPCFGLSNLEVVGALAPRNGIALEGLLMSESPRVQALGNFFVNLARRAAEAPLELMIDYMVGAVELEGYRSPFLEYYTSDATSYTSFELYENLTAFRAALTDYVKTDAPRLADIIHFVDDYEAAGVELTNASPYREAADAVQVMTVHKSKGMEFDHVFIMSADNVAWGTSAGNNNMMALPKNVAQIRHTGASDDEKRRLLFVAMTRARNHLYITNSLRNFTGKNLPRLEYLGEYEKDGETVSPHLPEACQLVQRHVEELDEAMRHTDLAAEWSAAYLAPEPDLRACLCERMAGYRLSATDLTSFIDVIYAGPLAFYRSRVLRSEASEATESLQYGTLIHAIFEKITTEGITDEEAIRLFREGAERAPLPVEEREALLKRGEWALPIVLAEFGSLLRSSLGRAEVNFGPEHLSFAGVPISGKLDHIEVDPEAKTVEIYDYKTGVYHAEDWGAHPTLMKYALQLDFYKRLVEAAPCYKGYKVTRAHILFVTPDDEGLVHDKVYEFSDVTGGITLEQLAPAVYAQALSLNFLDDPELGVEAKGSSGSAKMLRDFIRLVIEKSSLAIEKNTLGLDKKA